MVQLLVLVILWVDGFLDKLDEFLLGNVTGLSSQNILGNVVDLAAKDDMISCQANVEFRRSS